MSDDRLEESFLSVIGGSGGRDLLAEAAEFPLDALLKDGPIRDFPVVGTVAKFYSMALGAQGYIFTRKVRTFLLELASVPVSEREKFARQLESDRGHRDRTLTALLTFLDKMDDLEKAPLLARAFKHYLREEYDFSTLQRLAMAIDRCLVTDLPWLSQLEKGQRLPSFVGDLFVSAGLASIKGIPQIQADGVKNLYGLSEFGELFQHCIVRGLSRSDPPGA